MDTPLNSPAEQQWRSIGVKHHHGFNIPLFALHSENSCGIGEYTDLIPLIFFCNELNFSVIQLLPLNDTGRDTSPYAAISAFALNPLHLGLKSLPNTEKYPHLVTELWELQKFNKTPRVDYAAIAPLRERFLSEYIALEAPSILASAAYKSFVLANPWLDDYTLFKSLKEANNWHHFMDWEPEIRDPSRFTLNALTTKYADEMRFHSIVQFLCFEQLENIKKLANEKGVLLKGDIPILINRDSADVWLHRHLFDLKFEAGAPPDMYAKEGQVWGFPTYNWNALEAENYEWWKMRLKVAEHIYDIFRIDHVVGFYRIWSVPLGLSGSHGYFIPENKDEWVAHGEKILRMMVKESKMLPIGEDLGAVPPEVRTNLKELGICGTKVIRWERNWNGDKCYIPFEQYPMMSMTTVSTHDSEPLRLWWQNTIQEAKDFANFKGWNYTPELDKACLFTILRDSHHTPSLFHINLLNEYLALLPELTAQNAEDERINIPGLVSAKNWSYKFKPSVEEIVKNQELRILLQDIIKSDT